MLLILVIVLLLLFLFGGGWGYSRYGYWSWSPLGLILLVLLVLWLAGAVHAQEVAGGTAVSGLAFLGLGGPPLYPAPDPANGPNPTPGPVPPARPSQPVPIADPNAPPGLSYAASYWIGVALGLLLVLLGAINAVFIAGHGDTLGLTPQAFAWLSIFGVGVGFLGRFFPNIQHTTAARAAEFHRALKGYVPRDTLAAMERLHRA